MLTYCSSLLLPALLSTHLASSSTAAALPPEYRSFSVPSLESLWEGEHLNSPLMVCQLSGSSKSYTVFSSSIDPQTNLHFALALDYSCSFLFREIKRPEVMGLLVRFFLEPSYLESIKLAIALDQCLLDGPINTTNYLDALCQNAWVRSRDSLSKVPQTDYGTVHKLVCHPTTQQLIVTKMTLLNSWQTSHTPMGLEASDAALYYFRMTKRCLEDGEIEELRTLGFCLNMTAKAQLTAGVMKYLLSRNRLLAIVAASMLSINTYRFKAIYVALRRIFKEAAPMIYEKVGKLRNFATILYHGYEICDPVLIGIDLKPFCDLRSSIKAYCCCLETPLRAPIHQFVIHLSGLE